jgi:hypothetical protein
MNNTMDMEENIYSSSLGESKFADDTIEMSGNFFSQVGACVKLILKSPMFIHDNSSSP